MHKSKFAVALGAMVALVAAPLALTTTASASTGSNTGSSPIVRAPAAAPPVAAPSGVDDLKKQYANPSKKYKKGTCLADTSEPDFTQVTSEPMNGCKQKGSTVKFSTTVETRSVPGSWATWGAPPQTESATPDIWYTLGATSVTLTFSCKTTKAGFEVEPNPFEVHDYSVQFGSNAPISVTADGNAGARLAGAKYSKAQKFKTVTITDVSTAVTPADFSIGQIRAAC